MRSTISIRMSKFLTFSSGTSGLGFQFGPRMGMEVNYVGNKSTDMFGPSAIQNAINLQEYTQEFEAGINMSQSIPNPQGIMGANGQVINVTRANSLRPLSTLGDIQDPLSQGFDSRYNALQINFSKRFSRRFPIQCELRLDEGHGRRIVHGTVLHTFRFRTGVSAGRSFMAIHTPWRSPFRLTTSPAISA